MNIITKITRITAFMEKPNGNLVGDVWQRMWAPDRGLGDSMWRRIWRKPLPPVAYPKTGDAALDALARRFHDEVIQITNDCWRDVSIKFHKFFFWNLVVTVWSLLALAVLRIFGVT